MKNLFRSALVMCLALSTGLVGCSKDQLKSDENSNIYGNGQTKTVSISVSHGATKAPGLHQTAQEVVVKDATIYFTAVNGTIMESVKVLFGAEETANPGYVATTSPKTIGIGVLKTGTTDIENLPSTVTGVYVVANYIASGIGAAYPTTGNISLFNAATVISAASQEDAAGSADNIALWGEDTQLETATPAADGETQNAQYAASIDLIPVVARFEIGRIAADYGIPTPDAKGVSSNITSFNLLGIYLGDVYQTIGYVSTTLWSQVTILPPYLSRRRFLLWKAATSSR